MNHWGPEGPPPEAYSRVTNPERFGPLHPVAVKLLHRLEEDFDVERVEGYGLDPELENRLESTDLARPCVRLVPRDPNSAPIVIVFTAFPGLLVRFGRWFTTAFPECGCDACDETAEEEVSRLEELLEDVIGGRFREAIRLPLFGDASQEWELWSPRGQRSSGWLQVDRGRARELLAGGNRLSVEWKPWPRRPAS